MEAYDKIRKEVIKMVDKQTLLDLRVQRKEIDDKRDAGLDAHPDDVERFDDILYGTNPDETLDIYLPKDHSGKMPTIIHIHGGGWFYGTKETYQFYGLAMARRGFAFVNFNYPLAPEATFPAATDAINKVCHWVASDGARYDLDKDNVIISGDSCGAQMAEQYLAILYNDKFRQLFDYTRPDINVRAASLDCGLYFLTQGDVIKGNFSAYFTPEVMEKDKEMLNTEEYLTTDLPPLYLMSANNDPLAPHTEHLHEFLLEKGIKHEWHVYGDAENERGHVFHINQKDALADRCNDNEAAFYKKYLK